jgi:WD40 repeat protein
MRTFRAGAGRIHALAYSPDSRSLLVDLRPAQARQHPWLGFRYHPARELVWWDWAAAAEQRRFRLRDSLSGRWGELTGGEGPEDPNPEESALDVSFSVNPWRIATAWEWTNKEDGMCVCEPEGAFFDLQTPYKTHLKRLALSPNGDRLAAAKVYDMTGLTWFEVRDLTAQKEELTAPDEQGTWGTLQTMGVPPGAFLQPESAEEDECPSPFGEVAVLAFDGRFVAAAGLEETKFLVWDSHAKRSATEGEEAIEDDPWMKNPPPGVPMPEVGFVPRCLAFAPGTLLAVGGTGLILYDPSADRLRPLERSGPPVNAVAFDAAGRSLLAGTEAGTVELWDVPGGGLVKAFAWGRGPVRAAAFAPDGDTCAAGTEDGQVIVWDRDG